MARKYKNRLAYNMATETSFIFEDRGYWKINICNKRNRSRIFSFFIERAALQPVRSFSVCLSHPVCVYTCERRPGRQQHPLQEFRFGSANSSVVPKVFRVCTLHAPPFCSSFARRRSSLAVGEELSRKIERDLFFLSIYIF